MVYLKEKALIFLRFLVVVKSKIEILIIKDQILVLLIGFTNLQTAHPKGEPLGVNRLCFFKV